MRQRVTLAVVGTLASLLAGACSAGPPGPVPSATVTPLTARPCQSAALTLGYGPRPSEAEQEESGWYTLTNRGSSVCMLAGYPVITFYAAGGAQLGFHYIQGHSEYVTSAPPGAVILQPGASAWILIAKVNCIYGAGGQEATTVRITVPGRPEAVVGGPASATGPDGAPVVSCGDPSDPGLLVHVSPIEATRLATVQD